MQSLFREFLVRKSWKSWKSSPLQAKDEIDIDALENGFNFEELLGEDFSFKNEMGENEGSQAEDQSQDNIEGRSNNNNITATAEDQSQDNNEGRSHNNNILTRDEMENRRLQLYKAAIIGEWDKAEQIFEKYSKYIKPRTKISKLGETALHIATAADRTEFVQHLVDRMSKADLAIKAKKGNTAFCYAAVSGNIQAAISMLHKLPNLSTIPGEGGILPIRTAALHGHQEMVHYLYERMKHQDLDDSDWLDVFMAFIDCDIYDIGWKMVEQKPRLATNANSKGLTALYSFARKSGITSHNFSSNICGGLPTKYFSRRRNNVLRKQGLELLKLLLRETMSEIQERSSKSIKRALFTAAKQGNYDFIRIVVDSYPDLAFELDKNNYTIFHIAVSHRNVDIFNIVHEKDSVKNVIKMMKDNEGNNIVHLAGKLPLREVLEVVPGAALQLQRELLWFEEVKKVVGPHLVEAKNKEKRTPTDLFNEQHKDLRKQGEEWMKSTVNYCMVVSTLVAGVAFASAITVPGGTAETTGIPLLLTHYWFKIFAMLDAISLIFSASSILFFLTIFTSHYSMNDFLKSLPIKFILGLVLLSAAVQTMIVAFICAFFLIFKHHMLGFACSISAIASVPIIFFVIVHFPLVLRVIRSTIMSFLLFRPNKKKYILGRIKSLFVL